jgi:hypothetical protein
LDTIYVGEVFGIRSVLDWRSAGVETKTDYQCKSRESLKVFAWHNFTPEVKSAANEPSHALAACSQFHVDYTRGRDRLSFKNFFARGEKLMAGSVSERLSPSRSA